MNNLRVVFASSILQMKQSFSRPMFRACLFSQPVLYGLITYVMFKKTGLENFAAYSILGSGLLSLWSIICFSSVGDINRERYMGTLESIYCAAVRFEIIIAGKVLGNTLWGIFSMLLSYVFVSAVFQTSMVIAHPFLFIIAFIIALVSFIAISLVLAAVITLSRKTTILMNCLEYPVYILCGILFPIEVLPVFTRPLSWLLSPTWVVKLLRMSILGIKDYGLYFKYTAILTFITLVYFIITFYLFKIVDKKIRIDATLGVS